MNMDEVYVSTSDSLKAADLQGREWPVTISAVARKDFDEGSKLVLSLHETPRTLVLNKTNAEAISAAYGKETNGWIGQRITVFPMRVSYQGRPVDGIRLRPAYNGAAQPQYQAPQTYQAPAPMLGGQPALPGAGNAGPLPPAGQPLPGGMPNDKIPFAPERRV